MFCFGKKPRFLHKVKTTEVIERERNREPVRYHRSHRHGRNTFYSNGRYYSESRSRLPRAIELSRYHEDSSSFQPVRICNYREGDEHLLQQHSDNFDQYHVEEDDSREASREMVRYSANEEDERNDEAYHQPYYSAAPAQYPYYRPATVAPVAAQHHHHYTYVTPSRTPKVLPSYYNSRDYDSRRYAADRGAYSARRIKPADALPDDPFWCRERDGQWHLRTFYSIERECYPGRWQMDAEKGFLVYHRE